MFSQMLDNCLPNHVVTRDSADTFKDPYLMNLRSQKSRMTWKSRACCSRWVGEELSRGNRGLLKLLVVMSPLNCRLKYLAPDTQRILAKSQLFCEKLAHYCDRSFKVPILSRIVVSIIFRSLDVSDPRNNTLIMFLGMEAIQLGVTGYPIRKLWDLIRNNITAGDLSTRLSFCRRVSFSCMESSDLEHDVCGLLEYAVAYLITTDNLEMWNMIPSLTGFNHRELIQPSRRSINGHLEKIRGPRIMKQIVSKGKHYSDYCLYKYLISCGNHIPEILSGSCTTKRVHNLIEMPSIFVIADLHVTEEMIESGNMQRHVDFWYKNYPDMSSQDINMFYKDLCYYDTKTNAHLDYLNIIFPDIYLRKYYFPDDDYVMVLIKSHVNDSSVFDIPPRNIFVKTFSFAGVTIFHRCPRCALDDEDLEEVVLDAKLRYRGSRMKSARK